jgi:hypothetical protein
MLQSCIADCGLRIADLLIDETRNPQFAIRNTGLQNA